MNRLTERKLRARAVKIEITYHRGKGRADSTNIIGGIADALNKIAYNDDRQIKEVHYSENKKTTDEYWVSITMLRALEVKKIIGENFLRLIKTVLG